MTVQRGGFRHEKLIQHKPVDPNSVYRLRVTRYSLDIGSEVVRSEWGWYGACVVSAVNAGS